MKLPNLGPRTRKVLYYLGLVVLALVTLVFALQATFPYGRVKAKIEEAASAKVDMTIGDIERGFMPGVFYLKDVTIKTRPSLTELEKAYAITDLKERDKHIAELSSTIFIEKLRVSIGLFAGLGGVGAVDFDAKFGAGSIHGSLEVSKDGSVIHIVGDDVPSELLPMREVLSNLPMAGDIQFAFDLDLPMDKLKNGKVGPDWTKAVGGFELECNSGCIIGDGKAKLKLKAKNDRQQKFAGDGTDFGRVKIDALAMKAELKEGKFDIVKFDTQSQDVQLFVDFSMTLEQDINLSQVEGCLRFKGTDALRKREPRTFDQISLTGAARHTDGLDHIKLKGTFKDFKKLPQVCGPGVNDPGTDHNTNHPPTRPNLVVHPPDAAGSATPPAPTFTPPPPPPPPAVDAGVVETPPTGAAAERAGLGSAAGSAEHGEHGEHVGSGSDQGSADGSANPQFR